MLASRRISLVIGLACISLCVPAVAFAAAPATVTVRVEGQSATLIPLTEVTTTTQPVVKDGKPEDSCPGTSGAGALEVATSGNWSGQWFGGELGYAVETIAGESYPFTGNTFWDLWINNRAEEEHGVCGAAMQTGDQVLLFPCNFETGPCPQPLGVEAPEAANVGEPVTVSVQRYGSEGTPSAAAGATLSGASATASTDSTGHAKVTFCQPGTVTLTASAPQSVRAETVVDVHGPGVSCTHTSTPTSPSTTQSSGGVAGFKAAAPYTGPFALVAHVAGLLEGHTYSAAAAPRTLSGTVLAHSPVSSVSLELRREHRGRCWAYEGVRERFVRARCGRGSSFKVASGASFSYLLPSRLAPGRYVLDVSAKDSAGNSTTLARGTSRVVFYVR